MRNIRKISIALSIILLICLNLNGQDYWDWSSSDTLDFISPNRIALRILSTNDTLQAHKLTLTDLQSRVAWTDTSFVPAMNNSDNEDCIHVRYHDSYITIYPSYSTFSLRDSHVFELVVFESLGLKTGDQMAKARDIFSEATKREVVNGDVGAIFVPYFVKHADGKYYVADFGLYIDYNVATDTILSIYSDM